MTIQIETNWLETMYREFALGKIVNRQFKDKDIKQLVEKLVEWAYKQGYAQGIADFKSQFDTMETALNLQVIEGTRKLDINKILSKHEVQDGNNSNPPIPD